jgi:hypothetical protein
MHVYGANADGILLIRRAFGGTNPQNVRDALAQQAVTDLGLAHHAAGPAGAVSVDDAAVLSAYATVTASRGQLAIRASLVISRDGDASADYARRSAAATRIVTDLDSTAAAPTATTYKATWPVSDAPAILVVELADAPIIG